MIDTATFIAGVGVLVTLDLAVLGISVHNAREVGVDDLARRRASKALSTARKARAAADDASRRSDRAGDRE